MQTCEAQDIRVDSGLPISSGLSMDVDLPCPRTLPSPILIEASATPSYLVLSSYHILSNYFAFEGASGEQRGISGSAQAKRHRFLPCRITPAAPNDRTEWIQD